MTEALSLIPSYFSDSELACFGTQFFRSVVVKGEVALVEDLEEKARLLAALMAKFQPEGKHAPIAAEDGLPPHPPKPDRQGQVGAAPLRRADAEHYRTAGGTGERDGPADRRHDAGVFIKRSEGFSPLGKEKRRNCLISWCFGE